MTAAGYEQFVRLAKRADWMEQAACKGQDPNHWHPPRGGNADTERAKAICADCPVVERCLSWALDNGERLGIWGGVSIGNYRRGRQSDDPNRKRSRPEYVPIPHGTEAGYRMHNRRHVPMCDDCRDARNAHRRQLRADGRAA